MFRKVVILVILSVGSIQAFDPASQDDSLAVLRGFERPAAPVGPAFEAGVYEPVTGETFAVLGGGDVFAMRRSLDLDVALLSAFPDKKLKIRNLGWSGDTVYRQQRPMFFYTEEGDTREGSVPDQRERLAPGTMMLMFGKMESLDGPGRLEEFVLAYDRLLTEVSSYSERLIVVAPLPFTPVGPAAALAETRNEVLVQYTVRIGELAMQHGAIFIDPGFFAETAFGVAGLHLSAEGQRVFAERVAGQLGWKGQWLKIESLVQEKNHLWDQYYRPTNWAFLYGDRQHVPSSRDHRDVNRRWFEEELEKLPPMIASVEKKIWQMREGSLR